MQPALDTDRRDFPRMEIECPMVFKAVDGSTVLPAVCTSVSGNGLTFRTHKDLPEGALLEVTVTPPVAINGPLKALAEVVRSARNDEEFVVACAIREVVR